MCLVKCSRKLAKTTTLLLWWRCLKVRGENIFHYINTYLHILLHFLLWSCFIGPFLISMASIKGDVEASCITYWPKKRAWLSTCKSSLAAFSMADLEGFLGFQPRFQGISRNFSGGCSEVNNFRRWCHAHFSYWATIMQAWCVRLEELLLAKFNLLCFKMLKKADYNFFFFFLLLNPFAKLDTSFWKPSLFL